MKKTVAIIVLNLLIAGGLSARAGYMILSGCDMDGTCRGSSGLLTWGLAIVPALVLLVVLGMSAPKLIAALSVRRDERKQMKAEQAEVALANAAEAEQGQSRLARLKRSAIEDAQPVAGDVDADVDNFAYQPDLDAVAFDHTATTANSVEAYDMSAPQSGDNRDGAANDWTDSNPFADDRMDPAELDAIEREWQAAEAELDPAQHGYMAEPRADGDVAQDLPPAYVPAPAAFSELPAYQPIADDHAPGDFRLTPLAFEAPDSEEADWADNETDADFASLTDIGAPVVKAEESAPVFNLFDPAEAAAEDEAHDWHIAPAETGPDQAPPVPDWAVAASVNGAGHAASSQPSVDIWSRAAFDIDGEIHQSVPQSVPHGSDLAAAAQPASIGIDPVTDALPAITMPGIGRAPQNWNWLFADGLPLLRTSKATGFPWIAGGIGEVATAIQSTVDLRGLGTFAAEADAWVRIARSIPYAEALDVEDGQGFVEWCNALSIDLAASNQQDAFCQAVSDAMSALRGRARNDMETSLALPDAFEDTVGGAFGQSLSG